MNNNNVVQIGTALKWRGVYDDKNTYYQDNIVALHNCIFRCRENQITGKAPLAVKDSYGHLEYVNPEVWDVVLDELRYYNLIIDSKLPAADLSGRTAELERALEELTERRPAGTTVAADHCVGLGEGKPGYARSNFSGFGFSVGTVSRPFDTLEVPVLCADWEGNTKSLKSVTVVLRMGGHTGETLHECSVSFPDIMPGEMRKLAIKLSDAPLLYPGELYIEIRFDAPCTLYFINTIDQGQTSIPARYWIAGSQDPEDEGYSAGAGVTWWYAKWRLLLSSGYGYHISSRVLADLMEYLKPGEPGGIATLDDEGIVPEEQLPDFGVSEIRSELASTRNMLDNIEKDMLTRSSGNGATVACDHCAGQGKGQARFNRSNFSGFGASAGKVSGSFDTLEVPVLCGDWEGNTKPISSVCVVIRRESHTGEVLFSGTYPASVNPGESKTVTVHLSDKPLSFTGEFYLEIMFDAPCTLYFTDAYGKGDTEAMAVYFIGGAQGTDARAYVPSETLTWWFMRWRLLLSSGVERYVLSDAAVGDLRGRLDLGSGSGGGEGAAGLRVPAVFTAVEGDTLQLFYRGMVEDCDPLRWRPMLCGPDGVGKAFPRYWEFTPAAGKAGKYSLKLNSHDSKGGVTASASASLRVVARPSVPAKEVHVAVFGDSLTESGAWAKELRRRLCGSGGTPSGLGLTNVVFGGVKSDGSGAAWTGYGGWTWDSYTTAGPSGGDGAGSVTQSGNPLWNSAAGKVDFKGFADKYCSGRIDVVYVMLGSNSLMPMGRDYSPVIAGAKRFLDALHSAFPSARVRLMGIPLASPNGGLGSSYGSREGRYSDLAPLTWNMHRLNREYAKLAASSGYSSWVGYVEVAAQVDVEHCMPHIMKAVNTRATETERIDTNGLHPAQEGYLQIADAVYRDLCGVLTDIAGGGGGSEEPDVPPQTSGRAWFGVVQEDWVPSAAGVLALEELKTDSRALTREGLTLDYDSVAYCYPAAWGRLTSVRDDNGYQLLSSFTVTELTVGGTECLCYTLTEPVTAEGVALRFS